ncbi:MAG: VOC family protein [Acidobacteriota bacterium]
MVRRIHHLDFVVRDLDRATQLYRRILGQEPLPREHLPQRGIDLVRFRLGETWLILVQPLSDASPVMDFLRQHGEGFFHIAYQVDDAASKGQELADDGIGVVNLEPRLGVEGWKLVDLDMADTLGVMTQLVEQVGSDEN